MCFLPPLCILALPVPKGNDMNKKIYSIFLVVIALLVSINGIAEDRYGKQKAVYHINYDNPQAQAGALRNIQNHINAVGAENIDLKVVMHGKGLSLLLEPDAAGNTKLELGNATDIVQAKIAGLKDQGVAFQVCGNTLKGRQIDFEADLYDVDEADIVPSGVAELSRLQGMGYSYIKP